MKSRPINNTAQLHPGIAILLAMTVALGPLALDTYLPAFPSIASDLGVSVSNVSLSISLYVFVLALGQLVGGPLSDHFGRGTVMLSGLAIFGFASLLISATRSFEILLLLRTVQAFGGGWAAVCVPAIVRDRLSGQEAARFFSLIGLMMILAPALAPSLGSLILSLYDWSGIFIFLTVYAAIMVALLKTVIFSRSQRQSIQRQQISVRDRYRTVFATRPALRFMFLQALTFAVMLLFIAHSSFIYQAHFGASPAAFALLFGSNVVVMMVMNLVNRALLMRFRPERILRWSVTMQATGIFLLLLVLNFAPYLYLFLPAMMITVGAMGAITPNTQACFMDYFSQHGGTASALLGATQFSLAGLISTASAMLPDTVVAIILAQASCSIVCLLLIWSGGKAEIHQPGIEKIQAQGSGSKQPSS